MGDAAFKLDSEAQHARSAPRASVYVDIDVYSDHVFWTGLSMNMSEGGVFVATHHEVPVGTLLALQMVLPSEDEPLETLAEVRWTRAYTGQEDVPPGLGLAFVDIDEASLEKIRRFVSTVREPLFFEE